MTSEPGPALEPTQCLEEVEYIARVAARGQCSRHGAPRFPTASQQHCADCLEATGKGAEAGPKRTAFPKQLQGTSVHGVDADHLVRVRLSEYG
jgi:hypothetical protein